MIIRVHDSKLRFVSSWRILSDEKDFPIHAKTGEQILRSVRHCTLIQFVILELSYLGMLGCAATTSNLATPTISLALTQLPPASLLVGGTATLSATVNNDIANAGVDWVAVCVSTHPCGSFSPAHTDSGAATTFTAPADVPKNNAVAITALSATDHSKSFAANVSITSNVSGVLITMPPPLVLPAGGSAVLSATVAGDPVGNGVDWTVTCGSVTCGSFAPAHTDNSATTTFTATSALTDPTIVGAILTITAASTADHNITATTTVMIAASISIMITQAPPTSLLINAMATLKAQVSNDSGNGGVDWTVSCSNAPCGSFSPVHTANGVSTTFTAPNAIPLPGGTVTISAASTTDPSTLTRVTVIITAPISVQIDTLGVPKTVFVSSNTPLTATASNDPANAGLDWSVTCPSADCGSFSPTHTASGAATIYTAPASVPTGNTASIIATSTTDMNSKSTPLNINIAPITPNILLNGHFVFLVTGRDANLSFYSLAGTIVGDGQGDITAGEADFVDSSVQLLAPSTPVCVVPLAGVCAGATASTYNIGTDGRGQINITLPPGNGFGVNGTGVTTWSVAFVTPQHALLNETDIFGSGTGTLDLQNATDLAAFQNGTAGLKGTYSVALSGAEMANPNNRFFLASALTTQLDTSTSPPTVTETAAVGDQSDHGVVKAGVVSTTVPEQIPSSAVDLFGRFGDAGTIDLGVNQLFLIGYVIDANHFVITDARDPFVFGGYMAAQPTSPTISGTYAFAEAGATASPSLKPQVAGGILTCGSGGTLDVTPLGGTPTTNHAISSACTEPTNGRGLITISGAGTMGIGRFAAYPTLDKGLQIIEIDSSGGPSGAGVALPLPAPVSASAFSGKYASNFLASTAQGIEGFAGQVDSDGISKLSGMADVNSFNTTLNAGTPSSNVGLSGSYIANSNGRFPLTLNIATLTPQTIKPACYVVDTKSCLLLGLDATTPGVGILQLQQNLGF